MGLDVFAVGHALVDIQARVTEEILSKSGYHKGVMTLVDESAQQNVLQLLTGLPIHRCAGGSAANTAVGVADFGGKSAFAGRVAQDELGEFFIADMRKMGVVTNVPTQTKGPPAVPSQTGTSVVLISEDAQRTMLTHLGISGAISPEDIDPNLIAQSKYVYIEGYLFAGDTTRAAAMKTIEIAKQKGVKVAFTVSDPFLIHLFRDQFWELIRGPVDLLFCNLEEARSLTGKYDAIDCAQEIHRHAANVALTMGAEGSLLMHDGTTTPIESVEVNAIDSTGAGDMYAAGLLWGITNGLSWHKAGHIASRAAGRIVAQLGARLQNRFSKAELEELTR